MRPGIFAKTFAGTDPLTVMRAAKAAGFDRVQYNMACSGRQPMPLEITPAVIADIRTASAAAGVSLAAVSGTYNMIHPDPAVRADGLQRLSLIISVAREIGTDMVTLCTGTRDPDDQWRFHPDNTTPAAWADLGEEMTKALTLAEAAGIRLGIEPELANVVDSAAKARALIDQMQSDALVVVLDPANLFETAPPEDRRALIAWSVDQVAGHIAMAHAKDRGPDGAFVAAGTGVIDFGHFVGCLRNAGFDGDLVTHGLTAAEAPAVARFLSGVLG
jgi:sugar phosphate isomerase/epimerase